MHPFARYLCALAVVSAQGCKSAPRDPLDCTFPEHVSRLAAEATPPIDVEYSGELGTAPARMRTRIRRADPDWLRITACGLGQDGRQWEFDFAWSNLPVPPAYPVKTELTGLELVRPPGPYFQGSLHHCSEYGCGMPGTDAWFAFSTGAGGYAANTQITRYDPARGSFTASVVVRPGGYRLAGDSRVTFDITWDPARVVVSQRDAGSGALDGSSESDAGSDAPDGSG